MASTVPSIERAARGVTSASVLDFLRRPKRLLIGGKWVTAKSGKTFETINPANEEVLALVPEGDKADVDEAVKTARKAYESGKWPTINPHQRAKYLLTIADLIEKHVDELAILETLNNGMAISLARGFTLMAADTFRYYAGWATKKSMARPTHPIPRCSTHPSRTGWRLRPNNPLERSHCNACLEDCTSACVRQRVDPETRRADATNSAQNRRTDFGSGSPGRRRQHKSQDTARPPARRLPHIRTSTKSRSPVQPRSVN